MPISQCWKLPWIARTFQYVNVSVLATAILTAAQTGAKPRPHSFTPVPVPSSFLLVLAGMIGVLGWNAWRNRGRKRIDARD
jgi:hypothetical protein